MSSYPRRGGLLRPCSSCRFRSYDSDRRTRSPVLRTDTYLASPPSPSELDERCKAIGPSTRKRGAAQLCCRGSVSMPDDDRRAVTMIPVDGDDGKDAPWASLPSSEELGLLLFRILPTGVGAVRHRRCAPRLLGNNRMPGEKMRQRLAFALFAARVRWNRRRRPDPKRAFGAQQMRVRTM